MAREACAAHPPASREPTPVRGVALVLGGQNPITLEYQIYPPPIDTLVTGMPWRTGGFLSGWVEASLGATLHGDCFISNQELISLTSTCDQTELTNY